MPELRFQDWLDRVERTFFEDDFEGYAAACALPLTIVTRTATNVVADRDDLRAGFDAWRDMLRSHGVTDMVRTARDVEQLGDGLIVGRYDTRLLAGSQLILPPFASSMALKLEDGAWKAALVSSGIGNSEFPITKPHLSAEAPDGA